MVILGLEDGSTVGTSVYLPPSTLRLLTKFLFFSVLGIGHGDKEEGCPCCPKIVPPLPDPLRRPKPSHVVHLYRGRAKKGVKKDLYKGNVVPWVSRVLCVLGVTLGRRIRDPNL